MAVKQDIRVVELFHPHSGFDFAVPIGNHVIAGDRIDPKVLLCLLVLLGANDQVRIPQDHIGGLGIELDHHDVVGLGVELNLGGQFGGVVVLEEHVLEESVVGSEHPHIPLALLESEANHELLVKLGREDLGGILDVELLDDGNHIGERQLEEIGAFGHDHQYLPLVVLVDVELGEGHEELPEVVDSHVVVLQLQLVDALVLLQQVKVVPVHLEIRDVPVLQTQGGFVDPRDVRHFLFGLDLEHIQIVEVEVRPDHVL